VVVDEAAVAATAGRLRVVADRWVAAVLAHELTHCDGQEREDVAETRGTLWVGRQLGDRRIVQDALNAITYDIDENGHWRSQGCGKVNDILPRPLGPVEGGRQLAGRRRTSAWIPTRTFHYFAGTLGMALAACSRRRGLHQGPRRAVGHRNVACRTSGHHLLRSIGMPGSAGRGVEYQVAGVPLRHALAG
jgi:hypothetical protein